MRKLEPHWRNQDAVNRNMDVRPHSCDGVMMDLGVVPCVFCIKNSRGGDISS